MKPLNSPIEAGMRVLVILESAHPESLDINRLAFLDYGLLHSGDFGGPTSLHPDIPNRSSELGIKKTVIERGLQVMLRAGLVKLVLTSEGIQYRASEEASSFLQLLESAYVFELRNRAIWVVDELLAHHDDELRSQMGGVMNQWVGESDE